MLSQNKVALTTSIMTTQPKLISITRCLPISAMSKLKITVQTIGITVGRLSFQHLTSGKLLKNTYHIVQVTFLYPKVRFPSLKQIANPRTVNLFFTKRHKKINHSGCILDRHEKIMIVLSISNIQASYINIYIYITASTATIFFSFWKYIGFL